MEPTDTIGDDVRLYRGDCLAVLPTLATVDAIVTDPPYGINRDGMRESTGSHGGRKAYEFRGWDAAPPSEELFNLLFMKSRQQIIWGANYFTRHLPPSMGWLYWDKGQRICNSDGELAFTSMNKALRSITVNRAALAKDGAVHPTQKPVEVMKWSIGQLDLERGMTILDPFMGSGSTGVAAMNMGFKFIGIELDPTHYATAFRRLTHATGAGPGQLFSALEAS